MDNIASPVKASPNNRRFYGWIIFLAGIIIITIVAIISFSTYLENEIEKKIYALHGRASDIDVNLITRSLKVSDLELDSLSDSTSSHQYYVRLNSFSIRGISYYELAINKKIVIRKIILDSGVICYKKVGNHHPPDNVLKTGFKSFLIKDLSFINIETRVQVDTIMYYTATVSGQLSGLRVKLDSVNKISHSIERAGASIKNIIIGQNYGKYKGAIGSLYINTEEEKIVLDSVWVIPTYGKYEFARLVGEQIGRLSVFIPKVTLAGVKFGEIKDSSLVASKIEITSFELFSFKDKRLPFLRKRNIPLPMAGFLKLPYRIQIDSVIIKNSHVMIEEYPENGSESYEIDIKEINATITGLLNRPDKADANAEMVATGRLLNTGKINALFKFPLNGSSIYSARGTISKIAFPALNPILKSVDVRVESGYLNSLTFSFDYTEYNSKGVLEINYEDLRIISLDRNKTTTNEVRTVLINMFLKNSKNQFKSASAQTGIIDIERDRKRYIFNVWVKSILAGVKSSVVGGSPRQRDQKK